MSVHAILTLSFPRCPVVSFRSPFSLRSSSSFTTFARVWLAPAVASRRRSPPSDLGTATRSHRRLALSHLPKLAKALRTWALDHRSRRIADSRVHVGKKNQRLTVPPKRLPSVRCCRYAVLWQPVKCYCRDSQALANFERTLSLYLYLPTVLKKYILGLS